MRKTIPYQIEQKLFAKKFRKKIDFESMRILGTEKDDNKYKVSHLDMSAEYKLDGIESKIYIKII